MIESSTLGIGFQPKRPSSSVYRGTTGDGRRLRKRSVESTSMLCEKSAEPQLVLRQYAARCSEKKENQMHLCIPEKYIRNML